MTATELRIGNFVKCSIIQNGHLRKGDNHELTMSDFNHDLEDCFEPIPLTEEWLIKFGFYNKGKTNNTFYRDLLKVDQALYFPYIVKHKGLHLSISGKKIKRIKHVHQLQNLYFALTGEELTIKDEITTKAK
jgi:hypothetical protein